MLRDLDQEGGQPDQRQQDESPYGDGTERRHRDHEKGARGGELTQHQRNDDAPRSPHVRFVIRRELRLRDSQEERVVDELHEPDQPGHADRREGVQNEKELRAAHARAPG